MRTDTPKPTGSTATRIRAEFARARRRLVEREPAWSRRWRRRGLLPYGLATLGVVGALALAFAAGSPVTPTGGYLRSGQMFSNDDLIPIGRALDAKNLPFSFDRQNRVEVAADRLNEANAIVAKLDVGPRALSEIDKAASDTSLWDTPGAKDQRVARARNDVLAAMIRRLDGITGAYVCINRPKALSARRPAPAASSPGGGNVPNGVTAVVYLETRDDREISDLMVRSIVDLTASFEPDVRQDAVTVFDRKLRHYADACNPSIGARARDRARAEELAREISDQLAEIKGVQVSVRLVSAATTPTPTLTPIPTTPASPVVVLPPPLPPLPGEAPVDPVVGVNRPLDLSAEEPPAHAARAGPSQAPAAFEVVQAPAASAGAAPAAALAPMKAQVWVKVPRSFYLKATSKLTPSFEDYQPLVIRVEALIQTAVRHVVPPGQLGDVTISTMPDEFPAPAPSPPAASTDPRRALPWWLPFAAVAVVAATATGATARLLAVRRPFPSVRTSTRSDRGRYKIDEASDAGAGPGPSERVRELIRLNPEAAASVLHRWTGQGGPNP